MRKLTIAMSSALIAALSLPALADLSLNGSARYRLGAKEATAAADSANTAYRNGRLQLTVTGGNDVAGFETNVNSGFGDDKNSNAALSVDDGVAYGWLKMGTAKLTVGNFGASAGMGLYGVDRDDRAQSIQLEGGNEQFTAFVRSNRGHDIHSTTADGVKYGVESKGCSLTAVKDGTLGYVFDDTTAGNVDICEKKDYVTYGLTADIGEISFEYQHGNESVKGADDALAANRAKLFEYTSFDSIYASTSLGAADVEFQLVNTGAKDSDAKALKVGLPLDEYNLRFAYATFNPNYNETWAPFGSGILDGAYSNGSLTGNSSDTTNAKSEDTRFIGLELTGGLGDTGLNFAAVLGSFDDQVSTTSNSVYDINLSYAVAKGATVKVGMGEANDKSGLGASIDYSF